METDAGRDSDDKVVIEMKTMTNDLTLQARGIRRCASQSASQPGPILAVANSSLRVKVCAVAAALVVLSLVLSPSARAETGVTNIGSFGGASNNTVLVTDPGSLWTNALNLYVGSSGTFNSLTIANGGQVINASGYIGTADNASNNSVLVTGSGSLWSNRVGLYVGYTGAYNKLTIADGGIVAASNAIVGVTQTSLGNLITISGGSLLVTNTLGDGFLDVRNGTLDLNGGLVYANAIAISNGSFLIGSGTIFGAATNFGGISPGHSAGLLIYNDDLTLMDSSMLTMEVGGPTTNDYDRIVVNGFRVAGVVNVVFTNGYAPEKGAIYDLFSFGSTSGAFSQTNLPTFQYEGTDWDMSHLLADPSDPLSGSIIFVPEPSSGLLLALGAGVLGMGSRRREEAGRGSSRKDPPSYVGGYGRNFTPRKAAATSSRRAGRAG